MRTSESVPPRKFTAQDENRAQGATFLRSIGPFRSSLLSAFAASHC